MELKLCLVINILTQWKYGERERDEGGREGENRQENNNNNLMISIDDDV